MTIKEISRLADICAWSHVYLNIHDSSGRPKVWCAEKEGTYNVANYASKKQLQKRCQGCGMQLSK